MIVAISTKKKSYFTHFTKLVMKAQLVPGEILGNHHIYPSSMEKNHWFSVDFPSNQSIENHKEKPRDLMGQILHDLYDPRSCQSWGDRMTD